MQGKCDNLKENRPWQGYVNVGLDISASQWTAQTFYWEN